MHSLTPCLLSATSISHSFSTGSLIPGSSDPDSVIQCQTTIKEEPEVLCIKDRPNRFCCKWEMLNVGLLVSKVNRKLSRIVSRDPLINISGCPGDLVGSVQLYLHLFPSEAPSLSVLHNQSGKHPDDAPHTEMAQEDVVHGHS